MTGAKRRGRFVADYYVKTGGSLKRRRLSFKTAAERDAELERARELERRSRGLATDVDRLKTVAAFAKEWLAGLAGQIKARTLEAYAKAVALYIVPRLGDRPVVELTRRECKAFLRACRQEGVGYLSRRRMADGTTQETRIKKPLAQGSVYAIYAALRALLNEAVEEELIAGNPAARLGKRLHLHPNAQHRKAAVEARVLTKARLRELLEWVRTKLPAAYPLLLTLARCGLRLGEVIALRLDDYDAESRRLLVARAWNPRHRTMETPKHGARRVDVSPQLAAILEAHIAALRKVVGIDGKPKSEWLFPSLVWGMLDARNVRRLLSRIARDSELGRGLKPHDLRHTYGSILTAEGAPPQYIQAQMGHASIQITIDLYGSGLSASYQQGVQVLDDAVRDSTSRRRHSVRTGHRVVTANGGVKSEGGVNA